MMIPVDTIKTTLEARKGSSVEVKIPSMTGHSFVCTCPNPDHADHHPSCVGDLETGDYQCLECGCKGQITR